MKKLLVIFLLSVACCCGKVGADIQDYPVSVAHRGCWFPGGVPENSLDGVRLAARFGYWAVECDVKYTLDSVMVLMHDKTINRTMRKVSDYSEITAPVKVSDISFEELRTGYVLASDDPDLRAPIPTLEEELEACLKFGVTPMLHSKILESYSLAQQMMGDNWVCFNADYEAVRTSREFSGCLVLWDPGKAAADEVVSKLDSIGRPCGMSTMKAELMDGDYIKAVRSAGFDAQSSIWKTPLEIRAIHDGATIILSDWCWFPTGGRKADDEWMPSCRRLHEGEQIGKTFPQSQYSAVTLDVSYQGVLEITINGEKTYAPEHASMDTERIGLRMCGIQPAVLIKALTDTRIGSCRACYYQI